MLVLLEGLKKNFMVASVDVITCPDLTQPPWNLAAPGKRHEAVSNKMRFHLNFDAQLLRNVFLFFVCDNRVLS